MRILRLFTGFILAAILFLFACQLPGKIVQSIRRTGTPALPTPSLTSTKSTSQAGTVSATPLIVSTDTPVLAIPTGESTYPGSGTPGGIVPSQPPQASPSLSSPVVSSVVPETGGAIPGTGTPAVSGPLLSATVGQGGAPAPYPGFELGQATLPVNNSYPGPSGVTPAGSEGSTTPVASPTASATVNRPLPSPTLTKKPGLETPGPATPATIMPTQSPTPQNSPSTTTSPLSPIQRASSTPVFVLTATASSTQIFVIQTASPTSIPTLLFPTVIESPTATFFVPTETSTPTRTPFLTPTPTITLTPTPTRTPLPVPPWVSVKLHATDPHKVQLAAGKPQLIEFFAFWSGPSLAMAPVVQGIEREYTGQVNFIYLDIDDPATNIFKQQLHYHMEPHFFLLDAHGKVLQQWVGYVTVEQFRQALDAALP